MLSAINRNRVRDQSEPLSAFAGIRIERLSTVFESKADAGQGREADIEKLHAKIGQLYP